MSSQKAKTKMCMSHERQKWKYVDHLESKGKKNAYNMKLQCTIFLTRKLQYMQNKGKEKFQVPI